MRVPNTANTDPGKSHVFGFGSGAHLGGDPCSPADPARVGFSPRNPSLVLRGVGGPIYCGLLGKAGVPAVPEVELRGTGLCGEEVGRTTQSIDGAAGPRRGDDSPARRGAGGAGALSLILSSEGNIMRTKKLWLQVGLCAGAASIAVGQTAGENYYQADHAMKVEPLRVAKVGLDKGRMVFQSDWIDYKGGVNRATGVRIFDCYGDEDSDGNPDDVFCEMGGSRWFRGASACDMFTTGDMTVACDTILGDGATRVNFGLFWTAGGSGTSETCVVAIFTQEGVPCDDPDSFDYDGWLLDFGTLASSLDVGGYYTFEADIVSTGAWTLPVSGTGSYLQ